jgi:cell division septation protein DedD
MASDKQRKKKRWRYQIDLGPLSFILWGIFIFFILGWIFVLGIFVGRGFFPGKITNLSELKGEINKLQESVEIKETVKSSVSPSDTLETEPELAFYDKLTTKKDEAKNNPQEARTEIIKAPAAPLKPVTDQASGSNKKDVKPPSDSTPKSGSGKFTIQVASIGELGKAQKTVNQLIEKGFKAYYYETNVKGKTYYRIRCGKFSDRIEALKYSLTLEEKTGLKGYVTDAE